MTIIKKLSYSLQNNHSIFQAFLTKLSGKSISQQQTEVGKI